MSELKAFPHTFPETAHVEWGMDLRDYFAAKAMQAFIQANAHSEITNSGIKDKYIAQGAYEIADAMLKVRGK